MITLIEEHRGSLRQLCQRYRVPRLEVFVSSFDDLLDEGCLSVSIRDVAEVEDRG